MPKRHEVLHFMRSCGLKRGQNLLIIGAGGSIGTDEVLDFEREDFSKRGAIYDSIIDIVGKSPLSRGMRSLKKCGIYFFSNPGMASAIEARLIPFASGNVILSVHS
jgi:NADPH:quinone reductase-like Zn-dependent oxidoreductase